MKTGQEDSILYSDLSMESVRIAKRHGVKSKVIFIAPGKIIKQIINENK
jgi:hypothetical protein